MANQNPTGSATGFLTNGTANTAYLISEATLIQGFTDPDNDALRVIGLLADTGEVSESADGQWLFTPETDFIGTVTFDYWVTDNKSGAELGALALIIAAPQAAPTGNISISGIAEQNQTLTASHNLADVNGLGTMGYQWLSNGAALLGQTQATYALTQADVGKAISVIASYTDGLNKLESVSSAATAVVTNVNDLPTGAITINGIVTQNQTLTIANTLADLDGLGVMAYQWLADGVSLGMTGATYPLSQADVGKAFSVVASYTDRLGSFESQISATTAAVLNVNDLPTGNVTITGIAQQGQLLTVANTLADIDGLGAVTYQWQADAVTVGTGSFYALTQVDVGKSMSVLASYTDNQGVAENKTSAVTSKVLNLNEAPQGTVVINGLAQQSLTLTASNDLVEGMA